MKLLLLLLSICALGFSIGEKGGGRMKNGEISAEEKERLAKAWGMDPEMRRARLERIAKKAAERHGKKSSPTLDEQVLSVKTEKTYENAPESIFELNSRLGVDKYLFAGDLHLTEEQLDEVERELDGHGGRTKRQALPSTNKWTNNNVYFYFDNGMTDEKKTSVRTAQRYIQENTCISFIEDRSASNRIKVQNGTGCSAAVGMTGGEQPLNLGDGCEKLYVVAHEFIHSLGFHHMHVRSDRDSYITVNWDNVKPEGQVWYTTQNTINYTPYEYGSIMHYGPTDFATNSDVLTMTPKDMRYLRTMGHSRISFYDFQMINKYYGCDANCPSETSAQCQNGGYPNPRNCAKCNCPAGYGGDLCNERPSGCGVTLTATSEWQSKYTAVGNFTSTRYRNDITYCNNWITAPQGKAIQVNFTYLGNERCDYGCAFNGMEIKMEDNNQMTNPLICCVDSKNQVFTSSQNPTPIVYFSSWYYSRFGIEYRYVEKTTPPPTTTPPSTTTPPPTTVAPTTTQDPSCFDFSGTDHCRRYIEFNGDCSRLSVSDAMQYCKKSCGLC